MYLLILLILLVLMLLPYLITLVTRIYGIILFFFANSLELDTDKAKALNFYKESLRYHLGKRFGRKIINSIINIYKKNGVSEEITKKIETQYSEIESFYRKGFADRRKESLKRYRTLLLQLPKM